MKKGRCGTMTHDCKRHGTTTLFAALELKSILCDDGDNVGYVAVNRGRRDRGPEGSDHRPPMIALFISRISDLTHVRFPCGKVVAMVHRVGLSPRCRPLPAWGTCESCPKRDLAGPSRTIK